MKIRFCLKYDGQNHSEIVSIDSDEWNAMGPFERTKAVGLWALEQIDYWTEPVQDSTPKGVDYAGADCTSCNVGYYVEKSIQDDWNGKLRCTHCNHEVNRWN